MWPTRVRPLLLAPAVLAWSITAQADGSVVALTKEISVGPLRSGPPQRQQEHVTVVASPNGYFVTWQDARANDALVYGARLDSNGKVLDRVGFPISKGPTAGGAAAIAFDGANHLVAFRSAGDAGVRALRVGPAGKVLDKHEIVLSEGPGTNRVDSSFDGTHTLVTWQTSDGIFGVRVDTSGAVVEASPTLLLSTPSGDAAVDPYGVACGDGTCLVAWHDPTTAAIAAIRVSGAVIDAAPITIATNVVASPSEGKRIAFDGTDFVVAYTSVVEGAPSTRLARVTTTNEVTALPTVVPGASVAVEVDGTSRAVVTTHGVSRVAFDGSVVGAPLAVEGASPSGLACRGGACVYAWGDFRDAPIGTEGAHSVVYARRMNPSSAWTAPAFRLVSTGDMQRLGGVASRGSEGLVVWWQQLGTASQVGATGAIYAARIATNGTLCDPLGVQVSAMIEPRSPTTGGPDPGGDYVARAASDGAGYLVVWPRPSATDPKKTVLFAMRLANDATPIDEKPFEVLGPAPPSPPAPGGPSAPQPPAAARAPFVMFDGVDYAIAWGSRAVRVTRDGSVVAGSKVTLPSTIESIAYNGAIYLALTTKDTNVHAQRFDKAFAPIDARAFPITTAAGEQRSPSLATNGVDFFVAWDDARSAQPGFNTTDIYGTRVTAAGVVLDPAGLPLVVDPKASQRSNRRPDIAYSPGAKAYLVAWERGVSDNDGRVPESQSELRAIALDETGAVRAPGAFAIMATPYHPWSRPSIRALDGSKLLVAYERLDTQAPYGSRRAHARVVDLDPPRIQEGTFGDPDHVIPASTPPTETPPDPLEAPVADSACGCRAAGRHGASSAGVACLVIGLAAFAGLRRRRDR